VRELIKNLGKHHTILLSTHILPEVEMTCSRVIIINKGKIEASDTPQNLLTQLRTSGGVRLEAKTGADNGIEQLYRLQGIKEVSVQSQDEWSTFLLRTDANSDVRAEIFQLAVDRKWVVRELSRTKATLEDVFVEITQADA
jgi:ABC-2 type transport system ATP-binding protein